MSKEGQGTSLVRRVTATPSARLATAGVVAGGGTALALGGLYVEPSVVNAVGTVAAAAVSSAEGISATVGVGLGLAAIGVTAITDRSHWVKNSATDYMSGRTSAAGQASAPTDGGTLNTDKTKKVNRDYTTYTYVRCEHHGSGRRADLRRIAAYGVVVGGAVLGAGAVGLGVEHGAASAAMDAGTALAATGGVAAAASFIRRRVRHAMPTELGG